MMATTQKVVAEAILTATITMTRFILEQWKYDVIVSIKTATAAISAYRIQSAANALVFIAVLQVRLQVMMALLQNHVRVSVDQDVCRSGIAGGM